MSSENWIGIITLLVFLLLIAIGDITKNDKE